MTTFMTAKKTVSASKRRSSGGGNRVNYGNSPSIWGSVMPVNLDKAGKSRYSYAFSNEELGRGGRP